MTEKEIQRAWDALVRDVIDAKASAVDAVRPLVLAQQAEANIRGEIQPFVFRGDPVPLHLRSALDQAIAEVGERQRSLDAANALVGEKQGHMKAGVLDDKKPKRDK